MPRESVKEWIAHGVACKIAPGFKSLCGYVQLPEELRSLDPIPRDIHVPHHGLNYGPDEVGWLGFDTLHAWDHWAIEEIAPYVSEDEVQVMRWEETFLRGYDERIEWTLELLVEAVEDSRCVWLHKPSHLACRTQHVRREGTHVAQKVQVLLIDDLTGKDADETVTFGLDGKAYEIDLTTANADKLRDLLAPYAGAGRKVGSTRKKPAAYKRSEVGADSATIRAWARSNGWAHLKTRGRVPADAVEAFEKANKGK
jgi:hypothetical protein